MAEMDSESMDWKVSLMKEEEGRWRASRLTGWDLVAEKTGSKGSSSGKGSE